MLSEKLSYFLIALAIYLLGKSILFFRAIPPVYLVFDIAMAISLLCSNLPRVLPIPQQYWYFMQKTEHISLGIAIIALFMMILK